MDSQRIAMQKALSFIALIALVSSPLASHCDPNPIKTAKAALAGALIVASGAAANGSELLTRRNQCLELAQGKHTHSRYSMLFEGPNNLAKGFKHSEYGDYWGKKRLAAWRENPRECKDIKFSCKPNLPIVSSHLAANLAWIGGHRFDATRECPAPGNETTLHCTSESLFFFSRESNGLEWTICPKNN